nr:OB-fold domain-containing protein [Mycobacterium sp.]
MSSNEQRGIVSYGAYIPYYRLDRTAIRASLGQGGGTGTRTVAAYDEDSTSMGVEAARRALWGAPTPEALYFATTAPAYADKTNATAIHAALGGGLEGFATDLGAAVRGASGALRAAAATGGMAVLSDIRTGRPGSADEAAGGDGAVAFSFGTGDQVLAEILAQESASAEFLDRWRVPGEPYSRVWEERFGAQVYLPLITDAVTRALKSAQLDAPTHVIVSSPQARAARAALGAFPKSSRADGLEKEVGFAGAAHGGLVLADVLDRAVPGDTILLVVAADGADATVLRVTDAITGRPTGNTVRDQLAVSRSVSYPDFLTWRGFLNREPPRRPDPEPPAGPPAARSQRWKYAFEGSRCVACSTVSAPPQRVCVHCGAVDRAEPAPLASTRATVATFTIDKLAFSLAPPVVDVVIDFDGGGRYGCQLADVDPATVAIGDRVEMTFRRFHTAGGVHNYFWKARPVRKEH